LRCGSSMNACGCFGRSLARSPTRQRTRFASELGPASWSPRGRNRLLARLHKCRPRSPRTGLRRPLWQTSFPPGFGHLPEGPPSWSGRAF
jgi:hypothetical protein